MGKASVTQEIISYIEEHLEEELSLEKIAGVLHYSRYYAARAFKESTGTTLHKYIQGRRLDEAARKLAQTRQPIIEVALGAGYGSQQAFTQAFRLEYRCTPQEYRRMGVFLPRQSRLTDKYPTSYLGSAAGKYEVCMRYKVRRSVNCLQERGIAA